MSVGKQNLPPFFAEMTVRKQNLPPVFAEMSVGSKKSQFFDKNSRQEQKNRNFSTELAVGSQKIVIF